MLDEFFGVSVDQLNVRRLCCTDYGSCLFEHFSVRIDTDNSLDSRGKGKTERDGPATQVHYICQL